MYCSNRVNAFELNREEWTRKRRRKRARRKKHTFKARSHTHKRTHLHGRELGASVHSLLRFNRYRAATHTQIHIETIICHLKLATNTHWVKDIERVLEREREWSTESDRSANRKKSTIYNNDINNFIANPTTTTTTAAAAAAAFVVQEENEKEEDDDDDEKSI